MKISLQPALAVHGWNREPVHSDFSFRDVHQVQSDQAASR